MTTEDRPISSENATPRILIVRLSAVGDCIQTMPLACALRDHLPGARITWVVENAAAPLVAALPDVNRVITVPKGFLKSLSAVRRLRRELAAERCEISIDPQGLTKSAVVAWLSKALRRIGFARPQARELGPWLQTEQVSSSAAHMVDRYLELLAPLGIVRPAVRFGLHIPSQAETKADQFASRLTPGSGYAVLNPGAGWDSKRWPVERFADLARLLADFGLPSVVTWGSSRERAWAQSIVTHSRSAATLAPETSLLELAAVIRRAQLFVGSDTGPLHLAAAVKTPCIALFGASSATACGPYGSGHIALQAALDSSGGRKRPGADNWAMREISVEMVFDACRRLLEARG